MSGKHAVEYRFGLGQDLSDTLNDIYQTWPIVGNDGELDCEGEYVGDRRHGQVPDLYGNMHCEDGSIW